MRVYYILLFLSIWTIKLNAQSLKFKHDWEMKYLEHDIQFTSKKQAPVSFSSTGEPQAIMFVGATKLENSSEKDLPEIVKSEIEDIKKTINIDEYLETDYKAVDNIVSYFDKIVNVEIAIIKYRTFGKKGEQKVMPRSVKHVLFIKNNMLYNSTLVVLFAEDQDNLRSDQMTFVKEIINH